MMGGEQIDNILNAPQVIKNVVKTVNTAVEILAHLHSALIRAGFSNGADSYRKMSDVLVGQKLWSLAHATDEQLQYQFEEVAKLASEIYELLTPYLLAMRNLQTINSLSLDVVDQVRTQKRTIEDNILQRLRSHVRPMSLGSLQEETGCTEIEIKSVLDNLVNNGSVAIKNVSGRIHYKAVPQ